MRHVPGYRNGTRQSVQHGREPIHETRADIFHQHGLAPAQDQKTERKQQKNDKRKTLGG